MALYADLTDEQKSIVRDQVNQLRALSGQIARTIVQGKVVQIAVDADGGLRDIVTSLDNGEVVPNESGLAGAQSLSKADLANLVAVLDALILANDVQATRELLAQANGTLAGL
jgi:hypothetical protein